MTDDTLVAVVHAATGALQYLAPRRLAPPASSPLVAMDLPSDYEDGLYSWDAGYPPVLDLQVVRARRWAAVRAARDAAQDGGCASALGNVDTDAESRGKISGAVQMAMIAQAAGAPFAMAWTMHDNSTVVHDAAAMIAMGVAVGQHVAACHAEALARRAAIEAAGDAAAIADVPTDGGWPNDAIA